MVNEFIISLKDGTARPIDAQSTGCAPAKWTEDLLQHILTINPELLNVCDHLPIKIDGGSTEVSPDQLYIDELGRLVIVEIKNEEAKLAALAQLLAYSEHYHILPLGELDRGFFKIANRGTRHDVLANALNQLQVWGSKTLLNTKHNTSNPKNFSSSQPWPSGSKKSLNDFAKFFWGDHAFTITGAPARLVLIAPSFDKCCVELAGYLRKRFVPIELICINLFSNSKSEIVMHFESILEQSPQIEPTWRAVRQLWQCSNIRNNFSANAWADHLNYASFSFSAQDSPQARFWLSVENHGATLSTVIPDGWCPGTALKNKVRASLLDILPSGFQIKDRVWLRQEFALPQQEKEFLANAQTLATVVRTVLAQHSPRAENKIT